MKTTVAAAAAAAVIATGAAIATHGATKPFLAPVPGVTNPAVTQANIKTTVCKNGWTATVRPPAAYTSALKAKQLKLYHLPPGSYEEDHLISLELGGAPRDPGNLWPEPQPRARAVDQIEDQLHRDVCAGQITLAAGRAEISKVKHTQG